MPKKDVNQIILEEVDLFAEGLNPKQLVNALMYLQEDMKLLDLINKSQGDAYDTNDQITRENWAFFSTALEQAVESDKFQEGALLVNCKLYCVKKFTQLEFHLPENIEDILKIEIKKYFNQLFETSVEEFIEALFKLPFEFLSLVIRYVSREYDDQEDNTPSVETAEEFYKYVVDLKEKFIKNVDAVSKGETNILNISDAHLLLDTKAFYVYSALNVGVLEYLLRLFNNKEAASALYDQFGKDSVVCMKEQALFHPSYIVYLKKIKKQEVAPFFTSDGLQNEERDKTFGQYVKELFEPQDVIPKAPKQEEPIVGEPTDLEITDQSQQPAAGQEQPGVPIPPGENQPASTTPEEEQPIPIA